MSFKDVSASFVKLAEDGVDPQKIPKHYDAYYDKAFKMFQNFGHYGGVRDIPHNLWPIICLMADMQERICELTDRLAVLETEPSAPKVDMRTKAGRAMKAKQEVVGV